MPLKLMHKIDILHLMDNKLMRKLQLLLIVHKLLNLLLDIMHKY